MPSRIELLEYAKKMRVRGDSYRTILNYLYRQCGDDSPLVDEVMEQLELMEDQSVIAPPPPLKETNKAFRLLMGALFLVGGIIMGILLWDMGWVSTMPFILSGYGVYVLLGRIR